VLVIAGAAVSVARPTLADRLRSAGRAKLESDPAAAIEKASDSLALNDEARPTYWWRRPAYARLDMYEQARDPPLEATRREPHDYVTWALLGDLAVRRGDVEAPSRPTIAPRS
jgi:hypothetical protein